MPSADFKCRHGWPPSISSFILADVGDNYAILQWFTTSTKPKHTFELDYQISSSFDDEIILQKRILPNSQKLVMLKDLKSSTNYSSSIFSYNECGKSPTTNLTFETKTKILHPALTHVMPHEIILCLIVFLIWVIILRHFFVIYNRLAFVSPLTLGGYLTRKHSLPHHNHRSTSTSRSSSRHTLISKSSGVTKFNILENAVCTWRSETVLNGGNGRRRLSDNSMLPYLNPSEKISYYSNLSGNTTTNTNTNNTFRAGGGGTTTSNTSLFTTTGTNRSSFSGGPQIFLTTTTSKPNSRRPSSGTAYQQVLPPIMDDQSLYSCPTNMSLANSVAGEEEISSISIRSSSTAPIFQPLQNCSFDSNDERQQMQIYSSSTNETPTPTTATTITEPLLITRKVSEVLLGKATIDIRRCSTFSTTSDGEKKRQKDESSIKSKNNHNIRRKTILPYFSSFRNSLRKKNNNNNININKCQQMEALKEEREATPTIIAIDDYQNCWKHSIRKQQKQETKSLLSTPISMHPPALSADESFDSYVTASDVIIKIDSDNDE